MSDHYTPTSEALPPKGYRVEWISPSGTVVRGRYEGGAVWYPEGSSVYVYYTPVFWRALA
jgi:hypothetical protein